MLNFRSPLDRVGRIIAGRIRILCFGHSSPASHLEIFTRTAIEAMLGASGLGRAASVGGTRRRGAHGN
jgi:hypothetical protein